MTKSAAVSRRPRQSGRDVYLPDASALGKALPELLSRPELWSIPPDVSGPVQVHIMGPGDLGELTLINRGPRLDSMCRAVFSACLGLWHEAADSSRGSLAVRYADIAGRLLVKPTPKPVDIRAALLRLCTMNLFARHNGRDLQLPEALIVHFKAEKGTLDNPAPEDSIAFQFNQLFNIGFAGPDQAGNQLTGTARGRCRQVEPANEKGASKGA